MEDSLQSLVDGRRAELKARCEDCCGLCCVASGFTKSPDFALEKPAGTPCPNLTGEFRCAVHEQLRSSGFAGCVAFDCYGAGQKVTRSFRGRDWTDLGEGADEMFSVFQTTRQLQSLLWLLNEALALAGPADQRGELLAEYAAVEAATELPPVRLLTFDVRARKQAVDELLSRISDTVRRSGADPAEPVGQQGRAEVGSDQESA